MQIAFATVLALAVVALAVTGRRQEATLLAVVTTAVLIVEAETPFGIGNGKVPDLVGLDECTAASRLGERDLRWRFGNRAPVGGQPAACASGGLFTTADEVLAQRPRAGTELEDGAVVRLETACTREPHCAALGGYAYGVP